MLKYWIWLAHTCKATEAEKVELLRQFGTPENIYNASEEQLSPFLKKPGLNRDLAEARKFQAVCEKKKLGILTFHDEAYPQRLKCIYNPPILLYYKGELPDFDNIPAIGLVGTREASSYGLNTARRLGYQIARCGAVVISGLAEGIDAAGMWGALNGAQPVVGILGCGIDRVYPACNRELFRQTELFGCILSEFAPGSGADGWHFLKRNRIISALSNGVLVVEAPLRSGALNTANHALEQGRDVFVVPGNIDVATCAGSNRLLRDGATAVGCGWDVVSEYAAMYPDQLHAFLGDDVPMSAERKQPKVAQKSKKPAVSRRTDKKDIDNKASSPYIDVNNPPTMSADEQRIVTLLREGERSVDDVVAAMALPAARLNSMLTMLQVKGVVRRLPGNRISLNSN